MLNPKEEDVLFHLGYEWWMFRSTYEALKNLGNSNTPMRNALVESLLLHSRALIYFFHFSKKQDDWIVEDLGHSLRTTALRPNTLLDSWRVEVNKRVAHLTGLRETPLASLNIDPIYNELEKSINKVKTALNNDIPSGWIGNQPADTSFPAPLGPVGAPPQLGPLGSTGPAKP